MLRRRKNPMPLQEESREEEESRFTMSLAGLAVALFLLVASLYVIHGLRTQAHLEDCLSAGRGDCVPIDPPAAR